MDLLQEAGHHHQEGEEGDPCQAEGVHPWEQEAVVQEVVPEALVHGLEDHQGVDPEVEVVLNGDFVSVIARKIYIIWEKVNVVLSRQVKKRRSVRVVRLMISP